MKRLFRPIAGLALAALLLTAFSVRDVEDLIGTRAPAWTVSPWINTEPIELEDLRGKVVLVRWWTGPSCPYCRASAAALNDWQERYREDGLVVVGLYHHKARAPLRVERVKALARQMGFAFPVGVDPNWTTLRRWWLDPVPEARFTSVSFLLDHEGVIRHIHPGGDYVEGEPEHAALEAAIEAQLRRLR